MTIVFTLSSDSYDHLFIYIFCIPLVQLPFTVHSVFVQCTSSTAISFFFFFNDTAPPEIYPLPLHDALPISSVWFWLVAFPYVAGPALLPLARVLGRPADPMFLWFEVGVFTLGIVSLLDRYARPARPGDRKSTRLNSSH